MSTSKPYTLVPYDYYVTYNDVLSLVEHTQYCHRTKDFAVQQDPLLPITAAK
jgi:hypothetical protein